jgi:hypothetical protein
MIRWLMKMCGCDEQNVIYWVFIVTASSHSSLNSHTRSLLLLIAPYLVPVIPSHDMNGHINETAPPLVPIGEVKLVQVQIVVWFVRTCEVWIPFVLHFCYLKCMVENYIRGIVHRCNGSVLTLIIVCVFEAQDSARFVILLSFRRARELTPLNSISLTHSLTFLLSLSYSCTD